MQHRLSSRHEAGHAANPNCSESAQPGRSRELSPQQIGALFYPLCNTTAWLMVSCCWRPWQRRQHWVPCFTEWQHHNLACRTSW